MVDVVILLSAVLIVIVFAFTAETEIRWVGHALAGIISLLFSIAAAVVGAMLVGRMRRAQGVNLFGLHKKITIYLVALIVGAFFFGLWSRVSHGEPLFWQHIEPLATVVHGWFGRCNYSGFAGCSVSCCERPQEDEKGAHDPRVRPGNIACYPNISGD